MFKSEISASMNDATKEEIANDRAVARRTELLLKSFKAIEHEEHY